jgi:5-formyltetrahydrofolate cyclo-ligase
VEASFAGGRGITDSLIQLYLGGKKWAGSSIVQDFESAGDPLPRVGNYWIVLDSAERPRLLLKTVRVEIHAFEEITAEIARAEGEGDLSVEHWKKSHGEHYAPHLAGWGVSRLSDARVITEFFEILAR